MADVADNSLPLARIANLLALLVVEGESESNKVLMLNAAGFQATEIAALLGKQPNTVSVLLYQAKRSTKNGSKSTAPRRRPLGVKTASPKKRGRRS